MPLPSGHGIKTTNAATFPIFNTCLIPADDDQRFPANSGVCEDARLGLNSVASIIAHAKQAEQTPRGKTINDDLLRQMGEVTAGETDPVDDNRGSAEYKREMVNVLVRRAAQGALQRLA